MHSARRVLATSRALVSFEHGVGTADFYGIRPDHIFDILTMECHLEVSQLDRYWLRRPLLSREAFVNLFGVDYFYVADPG